MNPENIDVRAFDNECLVHFSSNFKVSIDNVTIRKMSLHTYTHTHRYIHISIHR